MFGDMLPKWRNVFFFLVKLPTDEQRNDQSFFFFLLTRACKPLLPFYEYLEGAGTYCTHVGE